MNEHPIDEREESTPAPEEGNPAGEYRYVRPDNGGHFTDAQYIPRDQAPNMPRQYSYDSPAAKAKPEEKPEKMRGGMRGGILIGLCTICVLLGAAVGILAMQQWGGRWFPGSAPAQPLPSADATAEPTLEPAIATPVPQTGSAAPADSSVMDPSALYDLACSQVVGITTEVTYYNRFGIPSASSVAGSGFILSEDGYILTNYHVIEYAVTGGYEVEVMLYNGESYVAEIVGYENDDNDIAVLKIAADGLNPVSLGDSNAMRVGQDVYAVGNPLGELAYSMTDGMISALDREITTVDSTTKQENTVNMFQISAAVNSGNSGGPVYNAAGEVIGIVTAKYSDTGVEGLGFAIPINDALAIANDLIQIGYVRGKPYMGITVQTVSSTAAQYYNMVVGAYVYAVEPDSAAQAAGLQMGDIITKLDDTEVTSSSDLTTAQKSYRAGDTAVLTVYRSGDYLEIPITFGEKVPDSASQP